MPALTPEQETALSDENTNDPLVRGYLAMSDAQWKTDIETVYRPDRVPIQELMDFLHFNTHKTDGTDTQDRAIWTRMNDVDALAVTPTGAVANPWGSTAINTITEIQQIKTTQLLRLINHSVEGNLDVDVDEANFAIYLAGAEAAGCMSTAQKTAINALPDNRQSRLRELTGLTQISLTQVAIVRA